MTKTVKDVFNAFLVEGATFDGKYELARIKGFDKQTPTSLIPFDKAVARKSTKVNQTRKYENYVHFYCNDDRFIRIWRRPKQYLPKLKKYRGLISPDFSLYWDMPLCQQIENTAHNRALGYWFEKNGISVIPNVRWGNEESYEFCFDGLPKNSTVAVGTHGCLKDLITRSYFANGLAVMTERLEPKTIIVYGYAPDDIFTSVKAKGIEICQFDAEFVTSRKKEVK